MFELSAVLGGPGGRSLEKKPDERRAEGNEEGRELVYDKIRFGVKVFYTQV